MEPTPSAAPAFPPAPTPPVTDQPGWPRAPRALDAGRGVAWWGEGWRVFMAAPLLWIGIVVVLILGMILVGLVPLLGNLAQVLLWPVFGGGLMLGCHALAQGRPLEFGHLVAGFGEGRAGPLIVLGLIALAVSVVLVMVMMFLIFGAIGVTGLPRVFSGDAVTITNSMIAGASIGVVVGTLVALVVYALFMMAWWFATPLVALNRAEPIAAIKASFDASLKNLGALVISGLIFIGLAIVATIPFGLGWLVLAPVAIGMAYASWREVFGE